MRWLRTLRWRLSLAYAGILAVLLAVLALVLNAVVGGIVYRAEFVTFRTEARNTVASQQRHFDLLVEGRPVSSRPLASDCLGAVSYQQAFSEAIATPLVASHTVIQQAYLLDPFGNVLAPDDLPTVTVGQPAPDVLPGELATLLREARQSSHAGTGPLADVGYTAGGPNGQPLGIELIAERYHTASTCVNARNRALGVIEVVTTFPNARAVLGGLRLVLLLAVLGVFAAGILIGGPLIAGALRPLARVTQTARRIASGDLSQRLRLPHTDDEIGQLARTFDEMIGRIQTAFSAQAASEAHMRQFIADASHELRTPLTAIRGYMDVLLRGAAREDPATTQQVLQATRREAERMSGLVNDLLTLARLDAGRPLEQQPVDLLGLAGEAVDQARMLAGEREVALTSDHGGRLLVLGDPDRLKQVLLILLDNALKYGRPAPEGWVRVRLSRTERGAVLSVADNGQGIAPADLPHVFDRFYRGERAARQRRLTGSLVAARPGEPPIPFETSPNRNSTGSGLGLAIARAIVRAHGGTLTVESQLSVGTTFTLALPQAPGLTSAHAGPGRASESAALPLAGPPAPSAY